ncbi:LOW QUALITY PROTEIN: hypothetical protein J0S82_020930 [Galemys pyrenaicus]|uniref:Uncharacterized protein n=1 Tax=Galemys pyrenaicus TaxID=202257 RepID=A0A8J6DM37_GALPY|nr:LOW QUALITY PROTEIN: hypothetical protein J0S82_020930 [Galemys pyrenaicus]
MAMQKSFIREILDSRGNPKVKRISPHLGPVSSWVCPWLCAGLEQPRKVSPDSRGIIDLLENSDLVLSCGLPCWKLAGYTGVHDSSCEDKFSKKPCTRAPRSTTTSRESSRPNRVRMPPPWVMRQTSRPAPWRTLRSWNCHPGGWLPRQGGNWYGCGVNIQMMRDDLTVTNLKGIAQIIEKKACNASC